MADRPTEKEISEAEGLFEGERQRGDPSEEMKREVRARLDATLAGKPPVRSEVSDHPQSGLTGRGVSGLWAGVRPPLVATGVGFLLVGGLGLLWIGRPRSSVERPLPAVPSVPAVPIEPPTAMSPPVEAAVPAPGPALTPVPPDSTSRGIRRLIAHPERRAMAPSPPAPVPSVRDADLDLAIERDLLQRARAEFRAGHLTEALRPLEEHARRFPKGRLEEERAALRIQTLARLGEARQAADLAREFSVQFPGSPLLGAVRASIGSAGGATP